MVPVMDLQWSVMMVIYLHAMLLIYLIIVWDFIHNVDISKWLMHVVDSRYMNIELEEGFIFCILTGYETNYFPVRNIAYIYISSRLSSIDRCIYFQYFT